MRSPSRVAPLSVLAGVAAVAIGVLTMAHVVNAVSVEHRLLDMDAENNLPTWFSSSLFLAGAGAAGAASLRLSRVREVCAWALLALLLLAFSLDETASLHEIGGRTMGVEPTLSLTQPVAAAVVVSGLLILGRLSPSSARRPLLLAAVVLVVSQSCASFAGLFLDGFARSAVETAEDASEMVFGLILAVAGLRAAGYVVDLSPRRIRTEIQALRVQHSHFERDTNPDLES